MLPSNYPREYFVLRETRLLRGDERDEALKILRSRPRRIAQAWSCVAIPWLLSLGVVLAFPQVPESPFFAGLGTLWAVCGVLSTGVGVCLGIDITLQSVHAKWALKIPRIEVWERIPPIEDDLYVEEYPTRVEVVAGTDDVWSQQWEGDDEDAQLLEVSAS